MNYVFTLVSHSSWPPAFWDGPYGLLRLDYKLFSLINKAFFIRKLDLSETEAFNKAKYLTTHARPNSLKREHTLRSSLEAVPTVNIKNKSYTYMYCSYLYVYSLIFFKEAINMAKNRREPMYTHIVYTVYFLYTEIVLLSILLLSLHFPLYLIFIQYK